MPSLHKTLSLLCMLSLFLPITSRASHKTETSTILKMGMVLEPNTLNPLFRSSTEEGLVNALHSRSLAHYNSRSDLIPHLADGSPFFKKQVLHFSIRENAKWNDGTPITCEDFKTGLLAEHKFRGKESHKVQDLTWESKTPRKCQATFKVAKPIYTLHLPHPLPTHLEKFIVEASQNEVEYLKRTRYATNPTQKGLWSGPFAISQYKPGYYFELQKNPLFYGKQSRYEKILIRFFKEPQSLINAYRTHEIDMILLGLTSSRAEELQDIIDASHRDSQIKSASTVKLIHLEFNLNKSPTQDLRVRKALSQLIDEKELAAIVGPDGELTGSLQHETDPNYFSEYARPTYSFNRQRALTLLKEAGYDKNSSGQWVDKKDKPLAIELVFNPENQDRERVAVYLQDKWSAMGITVHLQKHAKRVLFGEILKKGRFDVAVFGWSQPKLQINKGFFSSENVPTEENNWTGSNFARWKNKRVDQALQEADQASDIKIIRQHLEIFQTEFREELPWLPLYFERRFVLIPKTFRDFQIFPDWEPETYEFENW